MITFSLVLVSLSATYLYAHTKGYEKAEKHDREAKAFVGKVVKMRGH
jgi:hypothetical protein